jgi:predicted N-acyltransferase
MKVITYLDEDKWNKIVKSFDNWDIYYLCEYAISLMNHGDGIPLLLYYEDEKSKLCYVVMLNDIATIKQYKNVLPQNKYFDLTTPYGYGGPIIEGNFDEFSRRRFMRELEEHCKENNIITQFIRFHPLYQNQRLVEENFEASYTKETIVIDTSQEEIINQNLTSKNRNMIRKAKKLGVSIMQDNGERINDFIKIYNATMDRNHAKEYYYFEKEYFEYLKTRMRDNVTFFYSYFEEKIIGASIFYYNENYMHYHLSGAIQEYRHMAATNLLLYEAALWATKQGIRYLHLGGGVGVEDSLFGFKKQFNKKGHLPFYIGRTIFNQNTYNQLLKLRKEIDPLFDTENSFYIQYRK